MKQVSMTILPGHQLIWYDSPGHLLQHIQYIVFYMSTGKAKHYKTAECVLEIEDFSKISWLLLIDYICTTL